MKKNFIYNFLLTGSNLLLPLITFPYLARIFGADGIGISNFIISYGQNYIIVAALGLPIYGVREIAKVGDDRQSRSDLFIQLLTLHFYFNSLLLAVYFGSIFLFSDLKEFGDLAIVGGGLIFLNVFSVEWLFSGLSDFKYISIRTVIIRAVSVVCIFLFVTSKSQLLLYFIILLGTSLVTVAFDIYHSRKFITYSKFPGLEEIRRHARPVTYLGIYMVLTSIYSILPTTLLGFLSSKVSVGYYFTANKIIRVIITVFSSMVAVLIPHINLSVQEHRSDYLSVIRKCFILVISFGVPISFFVFLLAKPLVLVLTGNQFEDAIPILKIMSPIILIVAFAQILVLLILSPHRNDKEMVIVSLTGMIISLMINFIFIPLYAHVAAGWAQVLSELIVSGIAFAFAWRIIRFDFPIKNLIYNIICVIPFLVIVYFSQSLSNNSSIILSVSSILCGFYFIIYQYFFIKDEFIKPLLKSFITQFKK